MARFDPETADHGRKRYIPPAISRLAHFLTRKQTQEQEAEVPETLAKLGGDEPVARVGRIMNGIFGEGQPRAPELIMTDPGKLLSAHIEELLRRETADPRFTERSVAMAKMLAERVGTGDIVPSGYVMAKELLRADCMGTGLDGFGNPMPEGIRGGSELEYNTFFNVQAIDLARGAFGSEFADQILEFQRAVDI